MKKGEVFIAIVLEVKAVGTEHTTVLNHTKRPFRVVTDNTLQRSIRRDYLAHLLIFIIHLKRAKFLFDTSVPFLHAFIQKS